MGKVFSRHKKNGQIYCQFWNGFLCRRRRNCRSSSQVRPARQVHSRFYRRRSGIGILIGKEAAWFGGPRKKLRKILAQEMNNAFFILFVQPSAPVEETCVL